MYVSAQSTSLFIRGCFFSPWVKCGESGATFGGEHLPTQRVQGVKSDPSTFLEGTWPPAEESLSVFLSSFLSVFLSSFLSFILSSCLSFILSSFLSFILSIFSFSLSLLLCVFSFPPSLICACFLRVVVVVAAVMLMVLLVLVRLLRLRGLR